MRYVTAHGREFTLAVYSPAEWGAITASRLRALGCSDDYALAVEHEYATATQRR